MPALDLLVKMQASRTHMALVIDEYGGTDGLVSIEDVVEAIVGDIEDEHDEADAPGVAQTADGSFIVDARAGLEDVPRPSASISRLADAEDVERSADCHVSAGRVPGRGEIVAGIGEFEFEVLDADPRRVKRVKDQPLAARGGRSARGRAAGERCGDSVAAPPRMRARRRFEIWPGELCRVTERRLVIPSPSLQPLFSDRHLRTRSSPSFSPALSRSPLLAGLAAAGDRFCGGRDRRPCFAAVLSGPR